jgi:SOS response regulatory protein OraA/RecX
MGDQDGNAPGSAIISSDIFYPPGQPDREYPERMFANVGNNVFQPENNDLALHALLKRLGDQQFKAKAMQPFEDYRVQQAQAAAIADASRNASLSDTGLAREVVRSMVAERRAQGDADYLRRMLASGVSPEAAQKELQAIKDANAIQEAKRVDDREFQAKNLIQKMAAARGITPMVRESLSQSGAITNPQPSQAMSQAMGMPGQGAGSSPLEAGRQSIDSDFYARSQFGSRLPQEDEQQAFASMLAQGEIPEPSSGAYSMATLQGQERQQQIEGASEALAARLETIRSRGSRILQPLPTNIVAKDILDRLYSQKGKKPSAEVIFTSETIQDMRPLQLLIAMNLLLSTNSAARARMAAAIGSTFLGTTERPAPGVVNSLKQVVQEMNGGEANIKIPFATSLAPISNSEIVTVLQDARASSAVQREAAAAVKNYDGEPSAFVRASSAPFGTGRQAIAAAPIPGSPMGEPSEPARPFLFRRPGMEPAAPAAGPRVFVFDTASDYRNIASIKDNLRTLGARTTFTKRDEGIRLLNAERKKDGLPPLK